MKKIQAISALIGKINNGARFVKVVIRTIEFFSEELKKEFPDGLEVTEKPTDNGELISK